MTWIEAVVGFLASQGIGVEGVSLFIGPSAVLPDVDTPIALFQEADLAALVERETVPTSTSYVHNTPRTPNLTRTRLQVTTRAGAREDARLLAQQIRDALCGVTNDVLTDIRFLKIRPVQEPFDLPLDATGRARFDCNYEALARLV